MAHRYSFDRSSFSFLRVKRTPGAVLMGVLRFLLWSALGALVLYTLFALMFSTDTERRLRRENRLYGRVYGQMLEREQLVGDVIEDLQIRDDGIYRDIFHTQAPGINPFVEAMVPAADSISDRDLVEYAEKVADASLQTAARVEENLAAVMRLLSGDGASRPPLSMPLKNVTYAQIGASVGEKVNPFYKVPGRHTGLDIVASQGESVLAAAAGEVTEVQHSRKGDGNYVQIRHKGGYVTRYCHLGDISVSRGQNVRPGQKIGEVGISGNSYATHLHYEVYRDGEAVDPVQYLFASVGPEQYADMLYMSAYTGQSLD